MKYLVYKITRDDGKLYIGTTNTERLKLRMKLHEYTDRFKGYNFTYEILEKNVSHEYIMNKEIEYIKFFDSYKNGLNDTFDGKGSHLNPNFTTLGYHHTDETKRKISNKLKGKKSWIKGKHHSIESRKKMSESRKGKQGFCKLSEIQVKTIIEAYNKKTNLDDDRIGKIMKNGIRMSYEQVFCEKYGLIYNVSKQNIRRIINKETWINVENKQQI